MFRQFIGLYAGNLAADIPVPAALPGAAGAASNRLALLCMHPLPLARLMERVWLDYELTSAGQVQNLALPQQIFWNLGTWGPNVAGGIDRSNHNFPALAQGTGWWDHLIYAYFVENTRAVEIFRRIVREYTTGERLPVPNDPQAVAWLRTTEEMFFRDASSFPTSNLISQVRPDFNATRRNAYFRMFGMDLNHGAEDGRPYPYEKAETANRDFVRLFEQMLVDVWAARVNRRNGIGANPTDPAAIARTVRLLAEMLRMRRRAGLQREEFAAVSMASWFHLTVSFDSPIVTALNAQATTPGERLVRLGQRVGIAAHPRSREFLELANNTSALLRIIESEALNSGSTVPLLWHSASPLAPYLDDITTAWSLVTGRDIKAQATRMTSMPPALGAPTMGVALSMVNNGALARN